MQAFWIAGVEVGSLLRRRTGVRLLLRWSACAGCGTPLQKQTTRGVGEGFARSRSDA